MSMKKTKERLHRIRSLRRQIKKLIELGDIEAIVDCITDGYDYRDKYHQASRKAHTNLMMMYEVESRYYNLLSDHRSLLATIRNNPRLCNDAELYLIDNTYLPRSTVH